jgi:hypothetical protein
MHWKACGNTVSALENGDPYGIGGAAQESGEDLEGTDAARSTKARRARTRAVARGGANARGRSGVMAEELRRS